jgi:spore coat polysaccharide biosynthesis protein SpsF
MKVVAIIQARMGSTRLPGKVMKKILNKTLLEYQIERVKKCKTIDQIIIATTSRKNDNQIIEFCRKFSVSYYRGSEEDVLARYFEAATFYESDVIVRLTSDCPVLDPQIIDKVVNCYLQNKNRVDYVSNTLERTYPRGMDTEVMSYEALKNAFLNAKEQRFREHVTAYIYNHPQIFNVLNVEDNRDQSSYRLTVDTEEDLQLITNIIQSLYLSNPEFKMEDIIHLLKENQEWLKINAHIEQKKV